MKNRRMPRLLPLTALILLAGCEPVDNGAVDRYQGWDGILTDNILPTDRDVFLDIDESMPAADPCEKNARDAHDILQKHCASCHGSDSNSSKQGVPVFDFVMDDDKLVSTPWERQTGPALHFVVPGDPDNSQVYVRAAVKRDMPPLYMNLAIPDAPRVSFSEGGVLREWIEKCM